MSEVYHPNAYLCGTRNVAPGLVNRTKILNALEKRSGTAKEQSQKKGISYASALHHLHLLEGEKIVERVTLKPPYTWRITGAGQQRLSDVIKRE